MCSGNQCRLWNNSAWQSHLLSRPGSANQPQSPSHFNTIILNNWVKCCKPFQLARSFAHWMSLFWKHEGSYVFSWCVLILWQGVEGFWFFFVCVFFPPVVFEPSHAAQSQSCREANEWLHVGGDTMISAVAFSPRTTIWSRNMARFSFNVRFPTCDYALAWNSGALQAAL